MMPIPFDCEEVLLLGCVPVFAWSPRLSLVAMTRGLREQLVAQMTPFLFGKKVSHATALEQDFSGRSGVKPDVPRGTSSTAQY